MKYLDEFSSVVVIAGIILGICVAADGLQRVPGASPARPLSNVAASAAIRSAVLYGENGLRPGAGLAEVADRPLIGASVRQRTDISGWMPDHVRNDRPAGDRRHISSKPSR